MKILVVEDEPELNGAVVKYLAQEGYSCEGAFDYKTALEKMLYASFDCVVVDLSLPGGNGLNLIRALKQHDPETGIIIISAKNALDDKIAGLEIGADDYLTKPFHLSELNARLKSVVRRRQFNGRQSIKTGNLEVVPDACQVLVNGKELSLTRKEYDLLLFFLANRNRVLTKVSIAEHLWDDYLGAIDSYDFVYTHIKNLRKKITEAGGEDTIETVYGLGYKFRG